MHLAYFWFLLPDYFYVLPAHSMEWQALFVTQNDGCLYLSKRLRYHQKEIWEASWKYWKLETTASSSDPAGDTNSINKALWRCRFSI